MTAKSAQKKWGVLEYRSVAFELLYSSIAPFGSSHALPITASKKRISSSTCPGLATVWATSARINSP